MPSSTDRQDPEGLADALADFQVVHEEAAEPPTPEDALLEFEEVAQAGHASPCLCEYCGEEIPDMGMGFMDHVEANEACAWQWDRQQPYIREDAGAE